MTSLFLYDVARSRRYSYEDLIRDLNRGSASLPEYLHTPDIYHVLKALMQALLLELPLVLLDSDFSTEEMAKLVPDPNLLASSRRAILDTPLESLDDLVSRLWKSQRAVISFFTSGTTGLPKRVDHRLDSLARSVRRSAGQSDAVWAFAYNPTHIAGCQVFLQAILNGNSMVNVFGLARDAIYDALENGNVSHISATPTFYRMLMPPDRVLKSVLRVTFGGERMDTALAEKLRYVFPNAKFLNVYASTEAGSILAAEGDVFSIKEALEGLIRVEENQLYVHRALLGVFHGSEETVAEWYATGDVVDVISTEPLRFRIQHRANELINVGGYKVNPDEVESILREHSGIADARVYAQKNSVLGNLVCCDVVLRDPSLTEKEIRQHLASQLQPFKVPRIMRFVDRIEQTRTCKTKRL